MIYVSFIISSFESFLSKAAFFYFFILFYFFFTLIK